MLRHPRLGAAAAAFLAIAIGATTSGGAAPPATAGGTLTGCGGKSLEEYGVPRDVYGTWMGRSSWENLEKGHWMMMEESGVPRWRREHGDRALDVGVPLIPTDSGANHDDLLREAASGRRDATYRSLGGSLARYGTKTVYARLWWEFNMPPARQDPGLFVAAWRRAVPLIREGFLAAAGPGQTLQVVWCANADAPDPEPFYPGDDQVDLVGLDVYGWVWGDSDPTPARVVERVLRGRFSLDWTAKFAADHGKPTCLGEWGNVVRKGAKHDDGHGAGDCPEYIDAVYDWAAACPTGCRYVCYFNVADGGVGQTLDQTPRSLARLKARASAARPKHAP
ncbi:glycosyl hydrolase [Paludisphaera mucosa]|uniref:Glycosyl hydrolase n=1 Tax=Paludisphaera mucosa TaxID=3030827 RepID=A0ABT6FAK6_9BACT|nr:glycosyl hydrolase [Paludisphaera mucosa]MDG3004595.1 glycosyl hydrolase [Paludisphaera mucosa]